MTLGSQSSASAGAGVTHEAGASVSSVAAPHRAPAVVASDAPGAVASAALLSPASVPVGSWQYVSRSLLAGGIAGCVAKTAVAPLDRVKILFQGSNPTVRHFSGTILGGFRAIHWINKEHGIRGVYRGHQATLIRIFPYAALNYMGYEQYKRLMFKQQLYPLSCGSSSELPPVARLLCGSAAGLTSVLFTYPLDYVHSRITYQVKMTRYTGIVDTIRQTVSEAGVRGLYRGFGATAMGIIPYAGVSFLTYDTLKSLAAAHYAQKQHVDTTVAGDASSSTAAATGASTSSTSDSASPAVPVWVRLMCGAIAGASAQTASYPLDVVRRRMQLKGLASQLPQYRNTAHALWHIATTEGVKRLYIGLSINYIKVGPAHAVSFVVYEWCKSRLNIK